MNADHKKALRAISLELRHTLEGTYDERGDLQPGDLERRLNAIGVWRSRPAKPLAELTHLPDEDKIARQVVDAYLSFRAEAGVGQAEAVAEFVREAAYNWANRLLTLRCMEARGIIDEVILQKEVYGRRSLLHNRLGQQNPALLAQPDEGLFTVLLAEFTRRSRELPALFHPKAPAIALRPSLAAVKKCIGLLSGAVKAGSYAAEGDELFAAPDALGWAYQYWNAEEKDRVFEKVRTEKGAKIAGADIIPATQLYTEPYMVKFLVQNSLGALWMGMRPDSHLADGWEYYVRDADRAPVEKKPVRDITFLDPACGSGHFHLEAFDLLYQMYEAEGSEQWTGDSERLPEAICAGILNHNLYGIDIDERAIQIAQAALWMKAKEMAWDLQPEALTDFHHHFVATNIRLPRGKAHLEAFLRQHPEDLPLRPALETVFEGLENAHELGSLLQLEEPVEKELRYLQGKQAEMAQTMQQSNLFGELAKPSQGALPLGVESYDAWKAKTLAQLRAHFEAEAEAADLAQVFFGQSAGKGLALFDILARRYDVVAANPPYMGSRNMSDYLKSYLKHHYNSGKRDLYAAFVVRSLQFTNQSGFVSIITMNKWLYARAYAPLRCGRELSSNGEEKGERNPQNLLWNCRLFTLADLGSRAFDPENNFHDGVQVAMFIFMNIFPNENARISILDCNLSDGPTEKEEAIISAIRSGSITHIKQSRFSKLAGAPLIYRLSENLLLRIEEVSVFGNLAKVRQGICTTNDSRFVRMFWESQDQDRWITFAKGGGHKRWDGLRHFVVDWDYDGTRIKQYITDTPHAIHWSGRMPESWYFFREGWSYSRIAFSSLGIRHFSQTDLFGHTNPIILFNCDVSPKQGLGHIALLNSPTTTYILRNLTQSNDFHEGYLLRMPYPSPPTEILSAASQLTSLILPHAESLSSQEITETTFSYSFLHATNLEQLTALTQENALLSEVVIVTCEQFIQRLSYLHWGLQAKDIIQIEQTVGKCRRPILNPILPKEVLDLQPFIQRLFKSDDKVQSIDENLINLANQYLNGQSISNPSVPQDESFEDNDEELSGSEPIPAFGLVDDFARLAQIDTCTAYVALVKSIKHYGAGLAWKQKIATDYYTIFTLRLLGYRWPKQIEVNEPVPDWAEPGGIIPITGGILHQRVGQASLLAQNGQAGSLSYGVEREFADIVGEKLADWLAGSFFTRHITQFKKRPIAWQLQTSPTPGQRRRGGPAFAALIYYHKLSADLLPTLRSQFVRDLVRAYETEQRTLRRAPDPSQTLSGDQEARLRQLEIWLTELQTFSDALQQVSDRGFGDTPALQAALRQYALDDAMQSLKSVWLGRLADKAASDALPDWQTRADKTGIHPALRDWIADAIAHLRHHCAQIGPSAPRAAKLQTDPDARAFAGIIGSQAKEMVAQSLRLAGDVWFGELDTHVLRPLLEEINALKAQQTALEAARDALSPQASRALYENEQAIKSLKAQISQKTKERNAHRKAANELREHIESWRCPAAVGWADWLGQQPLFDPFASLDGQRPPPQTVAEFVAQESRYAPDINDGVRVNIAPLQKAGLLSAPVLAAKELDKAIADRAEWRADERRWCREGKLPRPGWWV